MRRLLGILVLLCAVPAFTAEMTRLKVQVNSADTGKPIGRASVVIKFQHGRNVNLKKIVTNWETKTNQEGSVSIPPMPQGEVLVQVIAQNYQTFGNVYQLTEPEQTIAIKLNRPQSQYSEDAKQDGKGKQ
ncbi:MAG: carboxypeptidase regulatory-like domain-containing protein [Acidobacteriota bacterium]|nr:carboxypeptidase regulatory-like domain-containing protein [Acidobacteriota bacterium]